MKNPRKQIFDPKNQIHWESYSNMKKRVAEEDAKKKEAKNTIKKKTVEKEKGK